jgi:hypothetical protein
LFLFLFLFCSFHFCDQNLTSNLESDCTCNLAVYGVNHIINQSKWSWSRHIIHVPYFPLLNLYISRTCITVTPVHLCLYCPSYKLAKLTQRWRLM